MSFVRTPSAVIEIGGERLTAAEAGVARLDVRLALGEHGGAELILWARSRFAGAGPGDPATITFTDAGAGGGLGGAVAALGGGLGGAGGETPVLTGAVDAVLRAGGHITIEALGATATLSHTYVSRSYLDLDVAGIVRDLAADAPIDEVEADAALEYYVVENRQSVWAHLVRLAELFGCDLSSAPAGGLRFRPIGRGDGHELRIGADVVDFHLGQAETGDARQIAPHGAASEAGVWHWLLADPLGAEAGPARIVGGITNRDAAERASAASAFHGQTAGARGQLVTVGRPAIRPGDSVTLVDLPGERLDPLRVREVHHRLDGRAGFTTALDLEGGGGEGAFGALGGLVRAVGL